MIAVNHAHPNPSRPGGADKKGTLTPGSRSALRFFRRRPGANGRNPFGIFYGALARGLNEHEFVIVRPRWSQRGRVRFGWLRVFGFACVFWSALERSASTYDCGEITSTPTPPGREGPKKRRAVYPG
jgi:hypothetical protein